MSLADAATGLRSGELRGLTIDRLHRCISGATCRHNRRPSELTGS